MANTLTISSLTETIYNARDIVAAEPSGFIQSVLLNTGSEGASIGGTVTSFRTATPTLNTSYTPAMTIPAGDDQTIGAATMTIGQVANVRIPITGEVERQLNNTAGRDVVLSSMFAQAFRKIRNAIETHVGSVAYKGASRATGTAGTTPFGSTFNIVGDVRKILVDNGTPDDGDWNLVMNTAAGTKLRQLANIYKVNEAGSDATLRTGALLNLFGFNLRESAGVASHTKGAGTGYDFAVAGEAVGETTLTFEGGTVNTTGIVAGDCLTHAGDSTNIYIVTTGSTATAGDIVIGAPGLLIAGADANEWTIGNSYTANVGFHRSAIELVMRPPAQPLGGDAAIDRMTVFDDKSGLVFEVAQYKGYGMAMFDVTCLYQAKVWKPEFVANMLG